MSSTGDPFAENAGLGFYVPGPFGAGIDVRSGAMRGNWVDTGV